MSYFNKAFEATMMHEGGYVDDPDDLGGETYRGISRVHHPDWSGWDRIKILKRLEGFPDNLATDEVLNSNIKSLYKDIYFDIFNGDSMPERLAKEMFDTAVNQGVTQAVRHLQRALNVLNREATLYSDISVDGQYGANTERALDTYLRYEQEGYLLKYLNIFQAMRYVEIIEGREKNEKYARGWVLRVNV